MRAAVPEAVVASECGLSSTGSGCIVPFDRRRAAVHSACVFCGYRLRPGFNDESLCAQCFGWNLLIRHVLAAAELARSAA